MANSLLRFVSLRGHRVKHAKRGAMVALQLNNHRVLDVHSNLMRSNLSLDNMSYGSEGHNGTMLHFLRSIENRPDCIEFLRSSMIQGVDDDDILNDGDYSILAPIIPDRNVFCIGKNYSDHICLVFKRS